MSQSSERNRAIVIFGRPGSGKSSLAARLASQRAMAHIPIGNLLRAAITRSDELGQRVAAQMKGGRLVDDALIRDLLDQALTNANRQTVIIDGFPRTMTQVPMMEQIERNHPLEVNHFVEVIIDQEEVTRRLAGRRICPTCGATYHTVTHPPETPERCACGSMLRKRDDDQPEIVAERQRIFHQSTGPVIAHYAEHRPDRFRRIDGGGTMDEVFHTLLAAIDEKR